MDRIKLTDEYIEIYDNSFGMSSGKAWALGIYSLDKNHLEQLKKQILENEQIVEKIRHLRDDYNGYGGDLGWFIEDMDKILGDK